MVKYYNTEYGKCELGSPMWMKHIRNLRGTGSVKKARQRKPKSVEGGASFKEWLQRVYNRVFHHNRPTPKPSVPKPLIPKPAPAPAPTPAPKPLPQFSFPQPPNGPRPRPRPVLPPYLRPYHNPYRPDPYWNELERKEYRERMLQQQRENENKSITQPSVNNTENDEMQPITEKPLVPKNENQEAENMNNRIDELQLQNPLDGFKPAMEPWEVKHVDDGDTPFETLPENKKIGYIRRKAFMIQEAKQPKIWRGLPPNYHRDDPSHNSILQVLFDVLKLNQEDAKKYYALCSKSDPATDYAFRHYQIKQWQQHPANNTNDTKGGVLITAASIGSALGTAAKVALPLVLPSIISAIGSKSKKGRKDNEDTFKQRNKYHRSRLQKELDRLDSSKNTREDMLQALRDHIGNNPPTALQQQAIDRLTNEITDLTGRQTALDQQITDTFQSYNPSFGEYALPVLGDVAAELGKYVLAEAMRRKDVKSSVKHLV